jgi:hypothetical protein
MEVALIDKEVLLDCLNSMTKIELGEFFNLNIKKIKKPQLIQEGMEVLEKSETLQRKIYNSQKEAIAFTSHKLEEYLGCTKAEKIRWEKSKRLKIIGYVEFSKWGKNLKSPLFDYIHTMQITPDQIQIWRDSHLEEIKKNKKVGTKKAVKTRVKNNSLRENFKSDFRKDIAKWYKIDPELAVTLELSFWTMWVSSWAKKNQVKIYTAKTKATEYLSTKDHLYELKAAGFKTLINSPYSELKIYVPELHSKENINFCDYHFKLWKIQRENYNYLSKWDFFDINKDDILSCKNCDYEKEENYYSLYYLKISGKNDELELSYSFHLPYPLGRNYLPEIENLERVKHEEQEGIFKFGRSVFKEEEIIFQEKTVTRNFEETLEKFKMYFK